MYTCPHCQQPGISAMRRACLGPALDATCQQCHQKVGVPWRASLLSCSPICLAFFLATSLQRFFAANPVLLMALFVIASGAFVGWNLRFVPLIKK
jgi:hypothetical protein